MFAMVHSPLLFGAAHVVYLHCGESADEMNGLFPQLAWSILYFFFVTCCCSTFLYIARSYLEVELELGFSVNYVHHMEFEMLWIFQAFLYKFKYQCFWFQD